MASLPLEIDDWPTFSPNTPHFFKIILEDNSRDRKLIIPRKFIMKFGNDLSSPVSLELSSGSEWKVELRRWDGELWFEKGWPEFSEFYSLDCGHLLVFGYEGNSKFRVCISDRSCTEIDYPLKVRKMEETDKDDASDDDSTDDSDDDSTCPRKTKGKSPLPFPRPHKKNRTGSNGNDVFPHKKDGEGTSISTRSRRFQKRTHGLLGRLSPLPNSGKSTALQKAYAFKSQNPSSFLVTMNPTYINKWLLLLPSEFHKLHVAKDSGKVILQVLDGRTWPVDFKYEGRARFLRGWMQFVRDNNLNVGDVCVFVSKDNIKCLFDVVFFRAIEAAYCTIDREQRMPEMEETDREDDDSVEILDDFPPCPKIERRSPIAPQGNKKKRTSSNSKARAGPDFLGAWDKILK